MKETKQASSFEAIEKCIRCLIDPSLSDFIHEGCLPVPAFGDVRSSHIKVATVGLNPSSAEFFIGGCLKDHLKRLPHLADYTAATRDVLMPENIAGATQRRDVYFSRTERTPNAWFTKMTALLDACGRNWNYENGQAVHVDIVACTTKVAWGKLPPVAAQAMIQNCSRHLKRTLALLPSHVWLLGDGKTAGNTLAGHAGDWRNLGEYRDGDGKLKPLRVRNGTSAEIGGGRRYCTWNIPVKYLDDEAVAEVANWISESIRTAVRGG